MGKVDPADAKVIVALGDPDNEQITGYGQYDQRSFLWVVNKLFPGALKDEYLAVAMANPEVIHNAKPPERMTSVQLEILFAAALKMVVPAIKGVTIHTENVDGQDEAVQQVDAKVIGVSGLNADGAVLLEVAVEGYSNEANPTVLTLDEIT